MTGSELCAVLNQYPYKKVLSDNREIGAVHFSEALDAVMISTEPEPKPPKQTTEIVSDTPPAAEKKKIPPLEHHTKTHKPTHAAPKKHR